MAHRIAASAVLALSAFGIMGCGGGAPDGDAGLDSGTDGGADTDSDADTDADTDTDTDADGDGDGGDGCDESTLDIEGVDVDMLVVLDRSNSMCNQGLWSTMTDAVVDVTEQMDQQVNFGLMVFPSISCSNSPISNQCAAAGINVSFDAADPVGDIADLLGPSDVGCCGGTPTAAALDAASGYFGSLSDDKPKYVLLATDGAPACNPALDGATCDCITDPPNCDDAPNLNLNCLDDDEAYSSAADLYNGGNPVYVIGVGDSIDWNTVMDGIADAGGTTGYYPAEDSSDLVAALQTIVGDIITCEFDIDWTTLPEEASEDQSLVNFYGDGEIIEYDEGCADGTGWTWVDDDTVLFCDESCADLKGGTWDTVTATFGCDSVTIVE
jgi:hypothetical protein